MKSQSSIIARNLPGVAPIAQDFWRNLKYYVRYYKTPLTVISIGLVIVGSSILTTYLTDLAHDHTISVDAKLYHYAIGSSQQCDLYGDTQVNSSATVPCTIKSVSKDNRYYTATFVDPDKHSTTTGTFDISYIEGHEK